MNIATILKKLDFNDKEIEVYLALLKTGRTTPSAIAKLTKIKRTTVYNTAKSLITRGVLTEDLGGKSGYLVPLPPESLLENLKRMKKEVQEKEELAKKAIEELNLINSDKQYPVPKLRFIEENNIEDFLYKNSEKWHDSVIATDGIWWGFQDHNFVEKYGKWIDWTVQQTKKKDYKVQLISNSSDIEKKLQGKYAVRKVKSFDDTQFTSTTWVAGEYLIMIVTRQKPYYLVEIHDATLAHNMREVFRKLWNVSK